MGNTADVRPEIGSRASEYSDARCDMIFEDVGCAPRKSSLSPSTWQTSGRTTPNTQSEKYTEAYNQYYTNFRL